MVGNDLWWENSDGHGPQFYGVLNCPCLLFMVPHNQVFQCQIIHFQSPLLERSSLANIRRTGFHFP